MVNLFSGKSADEVWLKAAELFKKGSGVAVQSSRIGDVEELVHTVLSIEDPRQRWVSSRKPALNPSFALAEVVWIMNGSQDSPVINFWNPTLPKFAGRGQTYHGAYGFRLRNHFGIDQLEKAYQALKNNPESRQVVLQIWDPTSDLPHDDGSAVSEDIPCNLCAMLKIREQKLEWMQIMRSNDLYRGLPYNLVQFTTLQEILAGWLEIGLGSYNQVSDSLHLYKSDKKKSLIGHAKRQRAENTDSLLIPKQESEYYLRIIFEKMKQMITPQLTKREFSDFSKLEGGHKSFRNILLVISADAARRKGWKELADELMKGCTNPAFRLLWDNWRKRFK